MKRPLPIDNEIPGILEILRENRRLVVRAEPGAGKTTRIPPAWIDSGLLDPGFEVLVLEPRRIAARAAATRVSQERGSVLGQEIGYQVRFAKKATDHTRVRYITEGILLRMLQQDPALPGVGAVILDEFHERSIQADLALAMLREIQEVLRDDLRVVVMSATLDPEPIRHYLHDCPLVDAPGREHPVATEYRPEPDPLAWAQAAARAVVSLADRSDRGSILLFVPGKAEIDRCLEALRQEPDLKPLAICPLHGSLPLGRQADAIQGTGGRRVIVATNLAESSVTVEGVTAVVDTGRVRVARYDAARGLDGLFTERISQASAKQRSGRAGRIGPGHCIRLYSESEFQRFRPFDQPEIERVDLSPPLLHILSWGADAVERFDWLTRPPAEALERGLALLADLGAVSNRPHRITKMGRQMLRLPLHPRHSRVLLEAGRIGALPTACDWVAILSERGIERRSRRDEHHEGPSTESDLALAADRLNQARRTSFSPSCAESLGIDTKAARHVDRVSKRLQQVVSALEPTAAGMDVGDEAAIRRAFLIGYPDRVIRIDPPGSLKGIMVGGLGVELDRNVRVSGAELVVGLDAQAIVRPGGGRRVAIRSAAAIEDAWLRELFPQSVETIRDAVFLPDEERVVARQITRYRDLETSSHRTGELDPEEAGALLADAAVRAPVAAITHTPALVTLLERLATLRKLRPELAVPDPETEWLPSAIRTLCYGRKAFAELRRLDPAPTLLGLLPEPIRHGLALYTPERIPLPSGREVKVKYGDPGGTPILAARLQEFFGLERTPTIDGGRVDLLLHLLAPNHRPVQVTTDLASFWKNVYPKIRLELRRRYPKHAWPEDPLAARPESGPSRRRPRPG